MSETERWALVEYLKSKTPAFADPDAFGEPMAIPYPPADLRDPKRVRLGRTLFDVAGCKQCHGLSAKGDGPSADEMKDDGGSPIQPTNFHRGVLRGGRTPRDIYRAIATGYSGTPMPAFAEALDGDKIWSLVSYLRFVIRSEGDPKPDDRVDECVVWDTCGEN